jgi:hypothetical protein
MLYFSYGSNLNLDELKKYINNYNKIKYISYVYLENYKFNYRQINTNDKYGYANIENCNNKRVYGILWDIDDYEFTKLYNKEGYIGINNEKINIT